MPAQFFSASSQTARAVSTAGIGERNSSVNSFIPCPRLQRAAQLLVETAVARARHAAVEGRAHDQMCRGFFKTISSAAAFVSP